MKKAVSCIVVLICLTAITYADAPVTPLQRGINLFENARYQQALTVFRDIILSSAQEPFHSDAYFWIARSFIAVRDYEQAEKSIDFFLYHYPDHSLAADARYQKGRLLYLQRHFEQAIQVLYAFIESDRNNPFVANAYFWIGECLFELGHFEDAHKVFTMITQRYPRSFKVEAARYRMSLIDFKYRENELLKLIKISHEEYLNALDEFTMRERSYENAIREYQRRLNVAMSVEEQNRIEELSDEIRSLTARNRQLEQQLSTVGQASRPVDPGRSITIIGGGTTERLLDLKARSLHLKSILLDRLERELLENP